MYINICPHDDAVLSLHKSEIHAKPKHSWEAEMRMGCSRFCISVMNCVSQIVTRLQPNHGCRLYSTSADCRSRLRNAKRCTTTSRYALWLWNDECLPPIPKIHSDVKTMTVVKYVNEVEWGQLSADNLGLYILFAHVFHRGEGVCTPLMAVLKPPSNIEPQGISRVPKYNRVRNRGSVFSRMQVHQIRYTSALLLPVTLNHPYRNHLDAWQILPCLFQGKDKI